MRRVINASDHFSWHLHRWMICPVGLSPVIWTLLWAQRAFSLIGIFSSQALISKHPLVWMMQIAATEIINWYTKYSIWWLWTSNCLNCWHSNKPESFIVLEQWTLVKRVDIVLPPVDLGRLSNVSLKLASSILNSHWVGTRWRRGNALSVPMSKAFSVFNWNLISLKRCKCIDPNQLATTFITFHKIIL